VHSRHMAGPDPAILISAREAAGLDRRTAARKIGLNYARGASGEERLAAIETGETAPTAAVLRRMALLYQLPLLTSYLPVAQGRVVSFQRR
jgi:transcriptional regulator with XRE-family HTH domain